MATRKNPFLKYIPDYDKEAEAFLKKYEYEDAITTPMPVPIWDIAKKMSLEVVQTEYLSPDNSVQGAIAFDDGIIDVYDWGSREYIGFEVHTGMVFIDADIDNIGRINNTLAHECFHWYKHRHYFTYNRTHNLPDLGFAFRCENSKGTSKNNTQYTDEEIMELQARTIAPKILMPKKAASTLLQELIKKSEGFINRKEATELMIIEFADTFHVSRQSAAIRMGELGFTNALEFYNQSVVDHAGYDDRKQKKSTARKHQQPIEKIKAFELFCRNSFLQTILNTGAFCYTSNGYFTLDEPKYVVKTSNGCVLTDYAQNHLSECTLDFSSRLTIDRSHTPLAAGGMMFRSGIPYVEDTSFDATVQNTDLYNKAAEFEKKFTRSRRQHKTANELLWEYMQDSHWNSTIFQDKTNLDAMNYSRVQKPDHKFKMEQLVAIGVGLSLTAQEMQEVLQSAGLNFSPTDHTQQAYSYLFSGFNGQSIDACNEFLKSVDVPPLGTQQRI